MIEFKITCPNCQQRLLCNESYRGVQFPCPTCGATIDVSPFAGSPPLAPMGAAGTVPSPGLPSEPRPHIPPRPHVHTGPRGKSWLTTFLLAWFLGFLGIDRFYNGRVRLGIGKLLTFGGLLVWSLIDCLLLLLGKYQDARGNYLQPTRGSHRIIALSIVGLVLVGNLLTAGLVIHTLKSGLAALETVTGNAQVGNPQDGFTSPEAVFEAMQKDPDSVLLHPPEERARLAYEAIGMSRLLLAFLDDAEQVQKAEQAFQELLKKYELTDRLEFSNTEDEGKITELANAAFADVDIKAFMEDLARCMQTSASSETTAAPGVTSEALQRPKAVSMENLSVNGNEATATVISSDGSEEPVVFVKSGDAWFLSFTKSRERMVAQYQSGDDELTATREVELVVIFENEASRNKATARGLLKDASYDRTSPCRLESSEETNSATLSFSMPLSTKIRSIRGAIMRHPGVTQVLSNDPFDSGETKLLVTFDSEESRASATAERLLQGVDYDRSVTATLYSTSDVDAPNQSELTFTERGSSDLDTVIKKIKQVPGVKQVEDYDVKIEELMKASFAKALGEAHLDETNADTEKTLDRTRDISLIITFDNASSLQEATATGLLEGARYEQRPPPKLEPTSSPVQAILSFSLPIFSDPKLAIEAIKLADGVKNVESTFGFEDKPTAAQLAFLRKTKGMASSPAVVFEGFKEAVQANNYSTAFKYLTPDSQTGLLIAPVSMFVMATKVSAAQTDPSFLKMQDALKKHEVQLETSSFRKLQEIVAAVEDKGQCYQDLMAGAGEDLPLMGAKDGGMGDMSGPTLKEWTSGTLSKVTTHGDTASGEVQGGTVAFKRINNIWLINLTGEEGVATKERTVAQLFFQEQVERSVPSQKEVEAAADMELKIKCMRSLTQVGLSFRLWSMDHNDQFPFNVPAVEGGTREFCQRAADGFDANAYRHFLALSNELGNPSVLVCPADRSKKPATDWNNLNSANVTYLLRSGPHLSEKRPEEVLVRCPVHGTVVLCDGSVEQPSSRPPLPSASRFISTNASVFPTPGATEPTRSPMLTIAPVEAERDDLFRLDRRNVTPGGEVKATFSSPINPPLGEKYWITIVAEKVGDFEFGNGEFIPSGARDITLTVPDKAGFYEVRLHSDYPKRSFNVVQRTELRVEAPLSEAALQGLPFNGTNDWLEVTSMINWRAMPGFTFEAWVRDWSGVIGGWGGLGESENSLWLGIGEQADGRGPCTSGWEGLDGRHEFNLGPSPTNRWVHIAMVFDTRSQSFYLDGQLKHQAAAQHPRYVMPSRLTFGQGGKGFLRSVRISHTAHYGKDFTPEQRLTPNNSTWLLLDVDNREGEILKDSSGHGRNAKIHRTSEPPQESRSSPFVEATLQQLVRPGQNPSNTLAALRAAALQAWFDRNEDYAATRDRMLQWAANTDQPGAAERVAKIASLRPIPEAATVDATLALAKRGIAAGTAPQPWSRLALGMAEYRAGHYPAADQALAKALQEAEALSGMSRARVERTAALYQAMSLARQGRGEEARQIFRDTAATVTRPPARDQILQAHHDDLILWLAYKEARSLLNESNAP